MSETQLITADSRCYTFAETEKNSFYFITSYGNEYQVNFSPYWQQDMVDFYSGLRIPIFEFYFEVISKGHAGMDKRIAYTVIHILFQFLERANGVVFYITQRDDGRSKELFKVYQHWYNMHTRVNGDELQKIDRIVYYGDIVEANLGCMYLKHTVEEIVSMGGLVDSILSEIYPNAIIKNWRPS